MGRLEPAWARLGLTMGHWSSIWSNLKVGRKVNKGVKLYWRQSNCDQLLQMAHCVSVVTRDGLTISVWIIIFLTYNNCRAEQTLLWSVVSNTGAENFNLPRPLIVEFKLFLPNYTSLVTTHTISVMFASNSSPVNILCKIRFSSRSRMKVFTLWWLLFKDINLNLRLLGYPLPLIILVLWKFLDQDLLPKSVRNEKLKYFQLKEKVEIVKRL